MSDKIVFDDYEAVNLLSVLRASGAQNSYPNTEQLPIPNPLAVLNSGDWIGQLINKLETRLELRPGQSLSGFESKRYGIMHPNFTPSQYIEKSVLRYKEHEAEVSRVYRERVLLLLDCVNRMSDE